MSTREVFILDPARNAAFVNNSGPRKHPTRQSVTSRFVGVFVAFNAIVLGLQAIGFWSRWSALSETGKREAVVAVVVTGVANLILRAIYRAVLGRAERETRLTEHGRRLEGQVLSCTGRFDGSFQIVCKYSFQTPDRRELTGLQIQLRPELQGAALPAAGTPVVVLYVDDSLYKAL